MRIRRNVHNKNNSYSNNNSYNNRSMTSSQSHGGALYYIVEVPIEEYEYENKRRHRYA